MVLVTDDSMKSKEMNTLTHPIWFEVLLQSTAGDLSCYHNRHTSQPRYWQICVCSVGEPDHEF